MSMGDRLKFFRFQTTDLFAVNESVVFSLNLKPLNLPECPYRRECIAFEWITQRQNHSPNLIGIQ